MSHLGRWLSALVDGELDDLERDRVLNHLAGCLACRREANELRALKRRMTALGDTGADSTMAGRLIELGRGDADLPDVFDHAGSLSGRSGLPGWSAHGAGRRSRQAWKVATGSAGAALMAVALAAFALGGSAASPAEPKVTPAVDTYWLQHSYDIGQVPGTSQAPAGPAVQGGPAGPAGSAGPSSGAVTPVSPLTPAIGTPGAPARADTRSASPSPAPSGSASPSPAPRVPAQQRGSAGSGTFQHRHPESRPPGQPDAGRSSS